MSDLSVASPSPIDLADLSFPILTSAWKQASALQRDHWIDEVSRQEKLAGHVLRLIRQRQYTIGELGRALHHACYGSPTQRDIKQAIRYLQDVELVEYVLGKVLIIPPAPVLPPVPDVDVPAVVLETPRKKLRRTWTRFIDLLAVAGWRLLDKLVWRLDSWLNPAKEDAKLPEPALPLAPAEAKPANISAMPASPRIPNRPTTSHPLQPGTIAKQRLRAISQKVPAIRKGKLGDESFLLDQPKTPAKTA